MGYKCPRNDAYTQLNEPGSCVPSAKNHTKYRFIDGRMGQKQMRNLFTCVRIYCPTLRYTSTQSDADIDADIDTICETDTERGTHNERLTDADTNTEAHTYRDAECTATNIDTGRDTDTYTNSNAYG